LNAVKIKSFDSPVDSSDFLYMVEFFQLSDFSQLMADLKNLVMFLAEHPMLKELKLYPSCRTLPETLQAAGVGGRIPVKISVVVVAIAKKC
jgi:hypothetical protein